MVYQNLLIKLLKWIHPCSHRIEVPADVPLVSICMVHMSSRTPGSRCGSHIELAHEMLAKLLHTMLFVDRISRVNIFDIHELTKMH